MILGNPELPNKQSRIAILHALANVEQWAIDTALDNIARFHAYIPNHRVHEGDVEAPDNPVSHLTEIEMPKEYFDDFIRMAAEEAKVCTLALAS